MAAEYGGLAFQEAIEYFRDKVRLPTRTWTDLVHGMHTRAFVVAGATKDELLADFQEALMKALEEGTTLEQFRKDFDRIVAEHGWEYRGGRNWRSRVIFDTNLRTAYMAGRYRQLTTPAMLRARPYWMYKHGDSRVPRPHHLAWDGLVLAADDPWWETNFPPNGWGCKCSVFALSQRDLERMGKNGPDSAPPLELEERRLGRGGPIVKVPRGVDPGWGYNVGEASWGRSEALRLMEDAGPWRELRPRTRMPADVPIDKPEARLVAPVTKGDEAALRSTLSTALGMQRGADAAELTDPTGTTVLVTQALVDHMLERASRQDGRESYFPLIPELIEQPAEIWVSFTQSEASGRVALRRRYVKAIELEHDVMLGLVADLDQGQFAAWTFFRGNMRGLNAVRRGNLVWKRGE